MLTDVASAASLLAWLCPLFRRFQSTLPRGLQLGISRLANTGSSVAVLNFINQHLSIRLKRHQTSLQRFDALRNASNPFEGNVQSRHPSIPTLNSFSFRGERPSARRGGGPGKNNCLAFWGKARGVHLEKTTSNIKYSGFQVQNYT